MALEGQKAGRNIHIKDKDGTTKLIASLERRRLKSKKQKFPRKSSLLKGSLRIKGEVYFGAQRRFRFYTGNRRSQYQEEQVSHGHKNNKTNPDSRKTLPQTRTQHQLSQSQKKRGVHKISARNSGARKWLRQFYGRLAFLGSFCWKTPMPIKFLLLGGDSGFF